MHTPRFLEVGVTLLEVFLRGPGGELRQVRELEPSLAMQCNPQLAEGLRLPLPHDGWAIDSEGRVAKRVRENGYAYEEGLQGGLWELVVR